MNKFLILFIVFGSLVFGQVTVDLTIENQQAVGSDFFFDLYLTRTGTNDLYLGTADFVLTFDSAAFTYTRACKRIDFGPESYFIPTD